MYLIYYNVLTSTWTQIMQNKHNNANQLIDNEASEAVMPIYELFLLIKKWLSEFAN